MATPHSIRPQLDNRPLTKPCSAELWNVRGATRRRSFWWSYGRLQDAVNPGAWVRHTASMRGRMTDDERRGLDRLTHHADRLDQVIRLLGDPIRVIRTRGDIIDDLAHALYREIRLELRQDYDAGEQRKLSKAERVYVQPALYGAYAELNGGSVPRPQRMLNEAEKAYGVIHGALVECRERMGEGE